MSDGSLHEALDAWRALAHATAGLSRRVAPALEAAALTPDQYEVLRILRDADPDGLSRGDLSERVASRAPDMTRMLDRLERDGWVARRRGRHDARRSVARITAAGLERLAGVEATLEDDLERAMRRLTRIQRRRLRDLADELNRP